MPKNTKTLKRFLVIVVFFVSLILIERQFSIWWGKYTVANSDLKSYSLQEAMLLAEGSPGKNILLNFSAYWCAACRRFESLTLSDPDVQQKMTDDFFYVRLEQTEPQDKPDFERFEVSAYPTLLILQHDNDNTIRIDAYTDARRFLGELERFSKK